MQGDIDELSSAFSALDPIGKAMFLSCVAHAATIAARESYVSSEAHPERDFEHPDGITLRDANNFVHRVTGYMMHVLDGSEGEGQDASVMMMIVEQFREYGLE